MGCEPVLMQEDMAYFRVDGDTTWQGYSRLFIVLANGDGNLIDTLFDDSLREASELTRLAAPHYRGGRAWIAVYGYRKQVLVFTQGREFDGETEQVLAIRDSIPPLRGNTIALGEKPPETLPVDTVKTGSVPGKDSTTSPSNPTTTPAASLPQVLSLKGDSLASINDVVSLTAQVKAGGSRLTFAGWDYNSDGVIDDSVSGLPQGTQFIGKPRYANPGEYRCQFVIRTALGQAIAARTIKVLYDPPVADAGEDTTVTAGTTIYLHARGSDGFGPIVKREWQIGDADFVAVTQQDTRITAPLEAMELECVLRVTDSDGLTATDAVTIYVEDGE